MHLRGCLNIMFQLSITIGILVAELINLGAAPKDDLSCSWHLCAVCIPLKHSSGS